MAKNPEWSSTEISTLLENYETKEMYELETIIADRGFERPPEGIKRKLEKLLNEGLSLNKERVSYIGKRKLWRKEPYLRFKEQLRIWRKNNPVYFNMWRKENPEYLKNWFLAHPGYSDIAKKRFLENHPGYYKNRCR